MAARVFISSTAEDLEEYRTAAEKAAIEHGFLPDMQPYMSATGYPPLRTCQERVDRADLVVVIVAYRYGWIPPDQERPEEQRSITWLECLKAVESKPPKEVLAFLVARDAEWPAKFRDATRLENAADDQAAADVQRDVRKLREFKAWLNTRTRAEFHSPADLRVKVGAALRDWSARRGGQLPTAPVVRPDRPDDYLRYLREDTSHIDIRGLAQKEGKAIRRPIDSLYVKLNNARGGEREPLEQALMHRRLVILGDPGSGKTTFLRHVAQAACRKRESDASQPFPVMVSVGELAKFLTEPHVSQHERPHEKDAPAWLPLFLASYCRDKTLDLSHRFFVDLLHGGPALLLVDGLDEAPTEDSRKLVSSLLEKAAKAWAGTVIAVTTRPQAFDGEVMLRGFEQAEVAPLDRSAIADFLKLWSTALFESEPDRAARYAVEVEVAIQVRPDIRRIASNPVMLTALAVLQWNEKRMPDHRADLYGSVIGWLATQRKQRQARPAPGTCLDILQDLARAMHCHPEGRKVQVERDWAAAAIAGRFPEGKSRALEFLKEEQVDSGIVVNRGGETRFWHPTFQEYLTALWLSNREPERKRLLFTEGKAWQPEWREVALFLSGLLLDKGEDLLNAFVSSTLDHLYKPTTIRRLMLRFGVEPGLEAKARTFELLAVIVRDLSQRKFVPSDPRYTKITAAMLAIFRFGAETIPLKVRLAAAEALGQVGDPRLRLPSDDDYWVTLPGEGFQIGRYPVTVWEYSKYVDEGGEPPLRWDEQLTHPNRPVGWVGQAHARAYCEARGVSLPTEEQWCRVAAGKEGRRYPWGNEPPDPDRANYADTGIGHPAPVGMFPQGDTPEGVADMLGNNWEWCRESGHARGASWLTESADLQTPRSCLPFGVYSHGFRCVREVPTASTSPIAEPLPIADPK